MQAQQKFTQNCIYPILLRKLKFHIFCFFKLRPLSRPRPLLPCFFIFFSVQFSRCKEANADHMPLGAFRSFSAASLSRNLEIHKVFLRFLAFPVTKNSSQIAPADMIIVYFERYTLKIEQCKTGLAAFLRKGLT